MARRILLPAARSAMVALAKTKRIHGARVAMVVEIAEGVGVERPIDAATVEMTMITTRLRDMDETVIGTIDTTEIATMAETETGNARGKEGAVIERDRDLHAARRPLARDPVRRP